ncbi:protein translocase SEC61 complex subunit gamma [Candidatus Woesearchaeota archaeon]|nr:protein translocase SEC61 complex subunit gamma [Candidatus Woesearchaeota archaeon]
MVWQKIKSYFIECRRVLKVTKKPTRDEFKTIVKVSGLGMIIIGLIGFLVTMVAHVITGGF